MAERWMTEVMSEACRFDEWSGRQPVVQCIGDYTVGTSKLIKEAAADLCTFERVCKTCSMEVTLADAHDLRLALKSTEPRGVDDPRTVVFVGCPDISEPGP
jgi:hypothetical protein